jgi:hypothetical protein
MRLKVYILRSMKKLLLIDPPNLKVGRKLFAIIYLTSLFSYAQPIKASTYGFNITDSKEVLYEAIINNDTIIVDKQSHNWIVSPLKFRNLENKTIIFERDVILQAKPGAYLNKGDALLKFINCKNIKIYGKEALLLMNKKEYTDGEWRMGISLLGCSDVEIQNVTISSSGGDGIYIDGYKDLHFSENIIIDNVISTNNKRQGISIISAKNVWVKNSVFKNTKGTLPEAGLDIEPDNEADVIINVNIENCSFTNNYHSGIVIGLDNLTDKSEPVSINFKDCYLSMNHDVSNRYPAAEIIISAHPTSPVKGNVSFSDIVINESNWRLLYTRKPSKGYHTSFKNISAINICKQSDDLSVIYFEVPDYFKSSGPVGGFSFENMYVKYNSKSSFFTIKGSSLRTLNGVKNVTGDVTIVNPNISEFIEYIKYSSGKDNNFDVKYTIKKTD